MNSKQIQDLIDYRCQQAHETLNEADILLHEQAFRGAINRAYYAMFYILLALLATRQLGTSKHSGALSLFDREFVKTGCLPRELSRMLHLAFDYRQASDYGETPQASQQMATETWENAKIFVAAVEAYLRSMGCSFAGRRVR